MDALKMDLPKMEQQKKTLVSIDTDDAYEWSYIRAAEGITINVVSAFLISVLGIIIGMIYAGWTLLLNVLHAPSGLIGILAFILLGAVLMLVILGIMITAAIRGMSSASLAGLLIGAVVGAAIGTSIDAEKIVKAQKQKASNL